MRGMIRSVLTIMLVCITCHIVYASPSGVETSGCTPGIWTTDLAAAKKYAKDHNIFYVIDCSKSSGCQWCNTADNLYNSQEFHDWSRANGIPIVYGDYLKVESGDAAAKAAWSYYEKGKITGWPFVTLVSPDGAQTQAICSTMVRAGVVYGPTGAMASTAGGYPLTGYFFDVYTVESWAGLFHYLINRTDDTPSKATRIVADAPGAETATIHGLYKSYWTNDLSYVVKKSGTASWGVGEDVADWYVFKNAEAGSFYTIAGDYRESEDNIGRIFVYTSSSAAANGASSISAAEANCHAQGFMNAMTAGGFQFEVPTVGDVYLQFTRRPADASRAKNDPESITIEYRFALQEGKAQKFGFAPEAEGGEVTVSAVRDEGDVLVTLNRTNNKGEDAVHYTLHGWRDGYADATAIEKLDFDYPAGDHAFVFADGAETATVRIPLHHTNWDDACRFYVSIDVGDSLNEEWSDNCRVDILETSFVVDGNDNPGSATAFVNPVGTRLLPGDKADWLKLASLAKGKIYKLTASTTNLWSGLSSLDVQVYKADGTTALQGKSVSMAKESKGEILFVATEDADYLVRISPTLSVGGEPLYAAYGLAMESFDPPVVQFAQAKVEFDSPSTYELHEFEVTVSGDVWPYSPRPTVRTVADPATEGSAIEGTDFVGLSGEEVGEGGTVTLTLKDAGKWRPERAFKLVLEPDPEGFYVIGDVSELEITLSGDDATPSPPMDKDSPIAVGKAFAMAEGRNLSHTNTSDTLYFSVPAGNAVLGADKVTVKPSGTEIGVFVYTNAAPNGSWVKCSDTPWSLRDLADPDMMPLLRFAEAGTAKVVVSRDPDDEVLACYSIGFTQWETPVVEFASDEWDTVQSVAAPTYVIKRSGDTQLSATVYATLTCVTARDGVDVVAFTRLPVVIPAGESEATVTVTNLTAATPAVWKGDRVFKLSLEVDDARLSLGACSEATVTLISEIPEYEDGDTAEENEANPAVTTPFTAIGDAQTFTRRLNGADVGDWFTFTGAKAGQSYRFLFLADLDAWTANVEPKDVSISFALPGAAVVATNLAAVIDSGCWNSPILSADGDIKVRVWRPGVADASVEYTVSAYEWPWPKMTFEKGEDEVSRDGAQTYPFKILRMDNLMQNDQDITNNVTVWIEGDASKYKFERQTFAFVPGQAETNLTVALNSKRDIWTGDESFTLRLAVETDETKEKIKTGEYASLVVAVKDSTPQYDAADNADHVATGATTLGDVDVRWNAVAAHLNGCEGRNTSETIGDDNVDWYKFTNLQRGKMYRFEARDVVTANIDADAVAVEFFFDPSGAAIAAMSLAELSASGYKTPKIADENAVYAKVSRAAAGTSPVYVAYEIAYKMQANRTVYFQETSVEANEAASVVVVNVVCETGGEKIDLSDVTATVAASEDPDAAHPALSPSDFYAGVVSRLAWPIETTGGVRRVKVPLANFDSVWEGDETFKLTLECDEDTELGGNRVVIVTITDKEPPECGIVSLTRIGEPLANASSSKTYAVREGDSVPVELCRVGGSAGAVTGVWTWASGAVQKIPLFGNREDGLVLTSIAVPVESGYQADSRTTCTLSLEGGAAVAADSVTKLSFSVTDRDYAGKIADYSANDLSRVPFRTSGTGWYSSVREGTVCSTGANSLKASVKGPGTLSFTASIPAGVALTAKVAGAETVLKDGENTLVIGAGMKSVSILASAAGVELSDIVFTPSEDFRKSGTFAGYAAVDGVMGKATLTVAQNGRVSGKFACADRSWTLSTKGGWDGRTVSVTAKSGRDAANVVFAVDPATGRVVVSAADGETRVIEGVLERNCWSDSPAQPAEAEALAAYQGYYTATLPQVAADGGDAFGSGYLLITVNKTGTVKATGVLADGQSVSMSGTLLIGNEKGEPVPYIYLFAAPSAYNSGWFHAFARFMLKPKTNEAVLSPMENTRWVRYGGKAFDRSTSLSGGWYDKTENLSAYYDALSVSNVTDVGGYDYHGANYKAKAWGGSAELPSIFSFNAAGTKLMAQSDQSGMFSISFTRSTGVFRGNEKVQYDVGGRTVTRSFSYKGALTPVREESDDVEGRGFFLMDGESYEIELRK